MRARVCVAFLILPSLLLSLSDSLAQPWRHGGGRGGFMGPMHRGALLQSHFVASSNCAFCHTSLWDAAGEDVSIDSNWRSTMMAHASRDPLWQAKMHSEVLRNPQLQAVIEERCSRCHTPMARTEARLDGASGGLLDEGFLNPANALYHLAREGVSCTLCHQIQSVNFGQKESFSGSYTIGEDRVLFGPFVNPFMMPMLRMTGFRPLYSTHVEGSELCATCHTLYVPVVDRKGNVVKEAPEQTLYLEWRHSRFGDGKNNDDRSCQDCHMPEAAGGVPLARMPHHLLPRSPFAKHYFVGGNVFLLTLLKNNASEAGVDASPSELDATIARTSKQLQTRTADVSLEKVKRAGDLLEIIVKVTNRAGHKLPSGFPSRRAWIHLAVTDGSGNAVFESGRFRGDGSITGNRADGDPSAFEPHHEVIDRPDRVQIYEAIAMDTEGAVTYTLLRAAEHVKDNRLLPEGFDKSTAAHDIKPDGEALNDQNFTGGSDLVTYRVATGNAKSPFTIKAEILYQTVSFAFVRDLLELSAGSSYVRQFGTLYSGASNMPVVVAHTEMQYQGAD